VTFPPAAVLPAPPAAPSPPPAAAAPRTLPRLLLAVLAGLVLYAAFPPLDLPVLAPVGVALLGLACRRLPVRAAALAGLLCGLALFVPLVSWTGTLAGVGAWFALALLQAAFFLPLGAGLAVTARLPGWPLWAAGLWVGQEALRSRLPFGGFPWGKLAFSQADTAFTPLAALGGAPLVTAAVALSGSLLLAAARRPSRTAGLLALAAVAVPAAGLLVATPADGPRRTVAVVQGNVPRLGLDAFAQRAAVLGNHVEATRELAAEVAAGRVPRPELVIWPENASDLDPFTDPAARTAIDGAVRAVGVPVLVGAVLQGPGDQVRNAGIVWDPQTGPGDSYIKQHPVPFGEYIPYRSLVRRVTAKVDLVPRDFARGTETGLLQVGPVAVGDVICFEVAYDGLVREAVRAGGRLVVVQTNNATFGRSGQSEQQLAMSRLRAVEHGRTVVVAATSGISAVIEPDGRVARRSAIFTRDVLVADVPVRAAHTLATRLGLLPEIALSLLGAGALLAGVRQARRTPS
jgi:apolipoprotein N-acyltransferase